MDGRLEPRERAAVEAHLADCDDCYEVWMEGRAVVPDVLAVATPLGQIRKWRLPIVAAAVAALLIVVRVGWGDRDPLDQLIDASRSWRPVEGRLSVAFEWTTIAPFTRSATPSEAPLAVQEAAARLRRLHEEAPTTQSARGAAVASLLTGRIDEAIDLFDEVLREEPSLHAQLDLTAALLHRSRLSASAIDAARALDLAEMAAAAAPSDPRAAFNLALAQETMSLRSQALAQWKLFLTLEPTGPWAEEAARHIAALGEPIGQPDADVNSPGHTRSQLTEVLLPTVAAALLEGAVPPVLATGPRGSDFADIDPFLSAITSAPAWPHDRRQALGEAISLWVEWNRLADSVAPSGLAGLSRRIDSAFNRATGSPLPAADARAAYSLFLDGAYLDAFSQARTLRAADTAAPRYAAALHYITGMDALNHQRISEAQDGLSHAVRLAQRAGDASLQATAQSFLAEVLDEQGAHAEAWREHLGALVACARPEANVQRASVLIGAAISAGHARMFGLSLQITRAVLDLPTQDLSNSTRLMTHLQHARALAALDRERQAETHLAEASRHLEATPAGPGRESWSGEIGWITGLVFLRRDPARAAEGLSHAIAYAQRTGRQFRLAELLLFRGRAYRAQGHQTAAVADWERGVHILEDQRPAINDEQRRISRTSNVWELFGELIDVVADPRSSLHIAERARARELLDHLRPDASPAVTNASLLQDPLPPNAVALEYVVRPNSVIVWEVVGTTVRRHEVAIARAELAGIVRTFRAELQHGQWNGTAGVRLSRLLLPPQIVLPPQGLLVLVPDGPLHDVPFAALPVPHSSEPLVARVTPVVTPSLTVYGTLVTRAAQRRSGRALLVGASAALPDLKLPALPGTREEIRRIANVLDDPMLLQDSTGTAASVIAALPDHPIIHLSGHARIDPERPSRSEFFLHPSDGRRSIDSHDLWNVTLRTGTVVVLAGCDTAAGARVSGEGSMSLARSFIAAGAAGVAGSLWRLDDDSVVPLLVDLHMELAGNRSLASALTSAQRRAIGQGIPPRVWASLVAFGS